MSAPEAWIVRVFETMLREGRVFTGWQGAYSLLRALRTVPVEPGMKEHTDVFVRDKKTETSTCRVCGHQIKGTYVLRSNAHLRLHIEQVQYIIEPLHAGEPSWEHADGSS